MSIFSGNHIKSIEISQYDRAKSMCNIIVHNLAKNVQYHFVQTAKDIPDNMTELFSNTHQAHVFELIKNLIKYKYKIQMYQNVAHVDRWASYVKQKVGC